MKAQKIDSIIDKIYKKYITNLGISQYSYENAINTLNDLVLKYERDILIPKLNISDIIMPYINKDRTILKHGTNITVDYLGNTHRFDNVPTIHTVNRSTIYIVSPYESSPSLLTDEDASILLEELEQIKEANQKLITIQATIGKTHRILTAINNNYNLTSFKRNFDFLINFSERDIPAEQLKVADSRLNISSISLVGLTIHEYNWLKQAITMSNLNVMVPI